MDSQLALLLDTTRPALDAASLCDADELAVARALRWGRERARRISDLAAEIGIPSRRVQELVQHLLLRHHWPIGTAMSEPYGNYLIDSRAELEETVALLRTRGISNLVRAAALKQMSLESYLRHVQTDLLTEE